MQLNSIPLPSALPDRDYIIDHIDDSRIRPDNFKGYGIFPGSRIKLLFNSPSRNPSAYEIMGAVIALRREDSMNIYVFPAAADH
ncbi:MAG: FeoA family protein [Bacillota bacterium]|nr:FeoA family protein [Bacillota bacterium]